MEEVVEEGKRAGWKQEGLISRRRGPLIAAELRERGDRRDKGEERREERTVRGYTVSNTTPSLDRPSALVSPRLPFRLALFGPPAAVFEFTSRRNLYENLTILAYSVGLVALPFKSFSLARPPAYASGRSARSCTHTRACKGVENVSNLAEKLANVGVWRCFELDM